MVLAAVQFTVLADFMTMSPIGPVLMDAFAIGPQALGWLVAVYTFSAAISGVLGALFADRFDRKHLLLALYALFVVSLIACSVAPGYPALLFARAAGGAFGGVLGAVVMTIVGDAIPESRRGQATGVVMTAFAVATIAGVPIGLLLAGHFGWHAPFALLAVLSAGVWLCAWRWLPSMAGHLQPGDGAPRRSSVGAIIAVLSRPQHLRAYLLVVMVMSTAFLVIPYISLYMALNVGIGIKDLPIVYLVGGGATLFSARLIGRLSDRLGKPRIFRWLAAAAVVPLIAITHLPPVGLIGATLASLAFFVLVSGRMIPMMAIVTSAADPALRGTFMSLNQTVQSLSQGAATSVASLMLGRAGDGRLLHYDWVGWLAVAISLASCYWVGRVVRPAGGSAPASG